MPRNQERSFCCGAGGGRMWMEEKIGSRINLNRVDEAIATEAQEVAIGCPFCRVMISDGMVARESSVEVLDVAQIMLRSVNRVQ
jgi:Fe-S oxidoreductase